MANTLPANITSLTKALETTRDFAAAGATSETYVKMGKDGRWVLGSDELEVLEGTEWAVNPLSFATGYSVFDANGTRLGEEMALLSEPPIVQASLPHVNGQWGRQVAFSVACVKCEEEPEDVGTQSLVVQRSRGGLEAAMKLLEAVIEKVHAGDAACMPIIRLETSDYKHKKYGKIYTPSFTIVDWETTDAGKLAEPEEEEFEEVEEAPAPKKRRERKRA